MKREMLGQIPASPSIVEPPPRSGLQPGRASRRSSDPTDLTDRLADPGGMLSDTGNERGLPVLMPAASPPAPRRRFRSVSSSTSPPSRSSPLQPSAFSLALVFSYSCSLRRQ